jgi:small subunit ribosomal protein S21
VPVEGGLERAISRLKRMMATEGVLKDVKRRRFHEKPSVKKKRKSRDAERRRRRQARRETRNAERS